MNNKRMKIILSFTLLIISFNAFGQYDKKDTLRKDVVEFIIKSEQFTNSNGDFTLYIEDIITGEEYNDQANGVFIIKTFNSSTYFHLILFENKKYEIVNMYESYYKIIDKLINYFKRNGYSCEIIIKYLEAVSKIKERNNKVNW
ncbi:MAG: hypothetical protein M0P32_01200 [Bacteroidales bacterium]|nr:hypothetical protein [Bacteroidales bacterium]